MSEYWKARLEMDKSRPELEQMERPCEDCAVTSGFYQEFSESLAKEPVEIQIQISKKWFCHCNPTKACRGNIDFLKLGDL